MDFFGGGFGGGLGGFGGGGGMFGGFQLQKPKIWEEDAFTSEFCGHFAGDIMNASSLNSCADHFHKALKHIQKSLTDEAGKLASKAGPILKSLETMMERSMPLVRKIESYKSWGMEFHLSRLIGDIITILNKLEPGQLALVPILHPAGETIVMLVESPRKAGSSHFNVTIINPDPETEYHPKTVEKTNPSKIKQQIALKLSPVPKSRLTSEGYWACAFLSTRIRQKEDTMYTHFFSWLTGRDFEGMVADSVPKGAFATPAKSSDVVFWKALIHTLKFVLKEQGLDPVQVKHVRHHVKEYLCERIRVDLEKVKNVRFRTKKALESAVEETAKSVGRHPALYSPKALDDARLAIDELLNKIKTKPCDDEAVTLDPPELDITSGWDKTQQPDSYPLFESFRRLESVDHFAGQKTEVVKVTPLNLFRVPETITSITQMISVLNDAIYLFSRISAQTVQDAVKNPALLVSSLIAQLVIETFPAPLGPKSRKEKECIWATPLLYAQQLLLLKRLHELADYYSWAVKSVSDTDTRIAVRVPVFGKLAAIADLVIRTPPTDDESIITRHLNGTNGIPGYAVTVAHMGQYTSVNTYIYPEALVARCEVLDYFEEVSESVPATNHMWRWEDGSKVKDLAMERFWKAICKEESWPGTTWGYGASSDSGITCVTERFFTEFKYYRNMMILYKGFIADDQPYQSSYLEDLPTSCTAANIGNINYKFYGFGGNNWDLKAPRPSHSITQVQFHTNAEVLTEDDLLHIRNLPTFGDVMGQRDSELLLSYLTAPYLRIPLILRFFATEDRLSCLKNETVQELLHGVLFEPDKFMPASLSGVVPDEVPTENPNLLATPYGLLVNELQNSPQGVIEPLTRLVLLAKELDAGTVKNVLAVNVILYLVRVVARTENYLSFVIDELNGRGKVKCARKAAVAAENRVYLEQSADALRQLINEQLLPMLEAWVNEAMGNVMNASRRQDIDEATQLACRLHYHMILLLRNVSPRSYDANSVSLLLSSFFFLTTRFTWGNDDDNFNEGELYDIFQRHRRPMTEWMYSSPVNVTSDVLSSIVRIVTSSASRTERQDFEWGVVAGPECAGKFTRLDEELMRRAGRGEGLPQLMTCLDKTMGVKALAPDMKSVRVGLQDVEINMNTMCLTFKASHLRALPSEIAHQRDIMTVFGHLFDHNVNMMETMQCAVVEDATNRLWVRLVGQEHDVQYWRTPDPRVPIPSDTMRFFPDDLETTEEWIFGIFEPLRQRYFQRSFFQPPIFILLPENKLGPDNHVAKLEAVCSATGEKLKEILVFRSTGTIHVYDVVSHGRRFFRQLVYTSDARHTLHEMHPGGSGYAAGNPDPDATDPEHSGDSSVILRHPTHPLNKSRSTETFIPRRLLKGLVPATLLETHMFWQDEDDNIRGYPNDTQKKPTTQDKDSTVQKEKHMLWIHWRELQFDAIGTKNTCVQIIRFAMGDSAPRASEQAVLKSQQMHFTDELDDELGMMRTDTTNNDDLEEDDQADLEVGMYRESSVQYNPKSNAATVEDLNLLLVDLAYAREGTPLYSLASVLKRIEFLSHVLVWTTKTDYDSTAGGPMTLDMIQLPRLKLSFRAKLSPDGKEYLLYSLDHAHLFVSNLRQALVTELIQGIPHSLILSDTNNAISILVPALQPFRSESGAFSTAIRIDRADRSWYNHLDTRYYLYPVHISLSFMFTPTLSSALYLLLLRFLHRSYTDVFRLVANIGTDMEFTREEHQIFNKLGDVWDSHPDCNACRAKISLHVADSPVEVSWYTPNVVAELVKCLSHISVSCRMTLAEEHRLLTICELLMKKLQVVSEVVAKNETGFRHAQSALTSPLDMAPSKRRQGKAFISQLANALREKVDVRMSPEDMNRLLNLYGNHGDGSLNSYKQCLFKNRKAFLDAEMSALNTGAKKVQAEFIVPELGRDERWLFYKQYDPQSIKVSAPLPLPKNSEGMNLSMSPTYDYWYCGKSGVREAYGQCRCQQCDENCGQYGGCPCQSCENWNKANLQKMRQLPQELDYDVRNNKFSFIDAFSMIRDVLQMFENAQPFNVQGPYLQKSRPSSLREGGYHHFFCYWELLNETKRVRISKNNCGPDLVQLLFPYMYEARNINCGLGHVMHWLVNTPDAWPKLITLPRKSKTRVQDAYVCLTALIKKHPGKVPTLDKLPRIQLNNALTLDIAPRPSKRTAAESLLLTTILPIPHDTSCNRRTLEVADLSKLQLMGEEKSILDVKIDQLKELADQPLRTVVGDGMVVFATREEQGFKPVSEELPFELEKHPDSAKTVARDMLRRIDDDTKEFAGKTNNGKLPRLVGIVSESEIREIIKGGSGAKHIMEIRKRLNGLEKRLHALRESDSKFVAYALPAVLRTVHHVPLGTAQATLMHLRRYGKQEAQFSVDFLVASLCSTSAFDEWMQLNPFLDKHVCNSISNALALTILRANRIGHINRICETLKELNDLINKIETIDHGTSVKSTLDAIIASLQQKANSLAGQLVVKRVFVNKEDLSYDPRFLLFEFTWNLVLRSRQHELILDMYSNITQGNSIVKQMIMGAGKTTVVGPVLALMLADGQNLVIQVVPPALLEFSRSVMRTTFSSVLQKQIFTFMCDRTAEVDSEVLSKFEHAKKCRGIVITTPSSIKSIFLKYVEVLHHIVDPGRPRLVAYEKEAQDILKILQLWNDAVLVMDEVDMLLHPLKSELNFPIGPKYDIDFTPMRWKMPIHLIDAIFYFHTRRVTTQLKESPEAHAILDDFRNIVKEGLEKNALQEMPHLILLNTEFYETHMKPILARWLLVFIKGQHMVGLSDEETLRYIQKRPTKRNEPDFVKKVEALEPSHIKLLNLSFEWLNSYLCHTLQKIDRVSFGIMSADDMRRAREDRPDMPRSRFVTAIPFVGKDMPSQSSEFAHPDVVIGLTILAYRYEGLRKMDFTDIMREIHAAVDKEVGRFSQRRTNLLYNRWVSAGGGKLLSSYNYAAQKVGNDEEGMQPTESLTFQADEASLDLQVLPLKLMKQANEDENEKLFKLFRRTPEVIHWYLCENIFPEYMRHQHAKLSASGQELGGNMMFQRRIGFSGTPSALLPVELGQCGYEPGTDGQLIHTLTNSQIVNYTVAESGWTVRSLLDFVGNASPPFHALIDTGALITGMSNLQVAQYLLKHGLPQMEGVVFLDELDRKMILVKSTGRVLKLAECGIPKVKRFAFYDQVHTTGMDIEHTPNAQAVQTLGKDMTFRDFSQGAYRMRGIGQGQTVHMLIIPEVFDLINKVIFTVRRQTPLDPARVRSPRTPTVLVGVTAWLLLNSIRSEHIQHNQLRIQSSTNVWRKEAFRVIAKHVKDFKISQAPDESVMKALKVFNEPVSFDLPLTVPQPRMFSEALESFIKGNEAYIVGDGVGVIRSIIDEAKREDEVDNPTIDVEMVQEQEEEREQEEEQEKEQEIEIEKFVDLAYSREEESYIPWKLDTLRNPERCAQFYNLQDFHLYKRKSLSFPDSIMLSRNYYNPSWSGHRRIKNVVVTMEWIPSMKSLAVRKNPSNDYVTIDQSIASNHLKRTLEIVKDHQSDLTPELLKELLLTALHFSAPNDPDWPALLKAVGNGAEAFLDILNGNALRAEEDNRFTVAVTLAEAETIRRVIHMRKSEHKPFIEGSDVGVRLNIIPSQNAELDSSYGFANATRTYQAMKNFQCLRYFDGDLHYSDPEIGILLRAMHNNTTKNRQMFFQQVIGCRRRARQRWEKTPIALIFLLANAFTLLHQRAVGLCVNREVAVRDLNLGDAFLAFNNSGTGVLSPDEVWGALRWCRLQLTSSEVLDFIDIADSQREGSIQYPDFLYVLTGSRELDEADNVDGPDQEDTNNKKLPTVPPYGLAEMKEARNEREKRLRAEEAEAMKEMDDENRRVFEEIEAEQIRDELEQLQTSLNPKLESDKITFVFGEEKPPMLTQVANDKAFRVKDTDGTLGVTMASKSLLRISLRALKYVANTAAVTKNSATIPAYTISAEVKFPRPIMRKKMFALQTVNDSGAEVKLAQWSLPIYVFAGQSACGGVPFEMDLADEQRALDDKAREEAAQELEKLIANAKYDKKDVTGIIRSIVKADGTLKLTKSMNELFTDPNPNVVKALVITLQGGKKLTFSEYDKVKVNLYRKAGKKPPGADSDSDDDDEEISDEELDMPSKLISKKAARPISDSDFDSDDDGGLFGGDSDDSDDSEDWGQRNKRKKKAAKRKEVLKKISVKKPASKKAKKKREYSDSDEYTEDEDDYWGESSESSEDSDSDESYDGNEDMHIFKEANPAPKLADVVGTLEAGRENVRLANEKLTTALSGTTYEWTRLADPELPEGWVVTAVDGKRLFRELSCSVLFGADGHLTLRVSEQPKAQPPFTNVLGLDQDPDAGLLTQANKGMMDNSDDDSDDDYDSYDSYDEYDDGNDDDGTGKPQLGADVKDLMAAIKRARQLGRGDRVKRNPENWQHGEDDGGDGTVGVVTKVNDDTVEVLWPSGKRDEYNWGKGGLFELIRVAKLPDGELFIDRVISNDQRWGDEFSGRERKWTCDTCYKEHSPMTMYRCNHCERTVLCRKCFAENQHNQHDFTEMKAVISEGAKSLMNKKRYEEGDEDVELQEGCEVELRLDEKGVSAGTRGIVQSMKTNGIATVQFGKKSVKVNQSSLKVTAPPKRDPNEEFDMDQVSGQELKPRRLNALNAALGCLWQPGLSALVDAGSRTSAIVQGDTVGVKYKGDIHAARVRCVLKDGRFVVSEMKGMFTIAANPSNLQKTYSIGSVVRFKRKVSYPNYGWGSIPNNQRYTMRLRVNGYEPRSDFVLLSCQVGRDTMSVDAREVESADATRWLMYLKGESSPKPLPTSANMIVDGAYTSGEKRVRFLMAKTTYLVCFPSGEIFNETPGSVDLINSIGTLEAVPARPFKEPRKTKQYDDGHWHVVSLLVSGKRITGLCDGKKIPVNLDGLFSDEADDLRDSESDEDVDTDDESDDDPFDGSSGSDESGSESGSSGEDSDANPNAITAASGYYPLALTQPIEVFHSTADFDTFDDNIGGYIERTYPRRTITNFSVSWGAVDLEQERTRHIDIDENTKWKCPSCGLRNSRQLDECEDCDEPRIAVVEVEGQEKTKSKIRAAPIRSREMDHVRRRLQNKLRQRYQHELDNMDQDLASFL